MARTAEQQREYQRRYRARKAEPAAVDTTEAIRRMTQDQRDAILDRIPKSQRRSGNEKGSRE